jgi:putative component of membrane protein insertase Oxa1/YidC/SpoIIIJ protein YidD
MKLSYILRYLLVAVIIGIFIFINFYGNTIEISQNKINSNIEKKLPFIKKTNIYKMKIISLKTKSNEKDYIETLVNLNIKVFETKTTKTLKKISSFFKQEDKTKNLTNTIHNLNIDIIATPYIKNNKIYLKVKKINFKNELLHSYATILNKIIPTIFNKKSIYDLDKLKTNKYMIVKKIKIINDEDIEKYSIFTTLKVSLLINLSLIFLIIILLLREIGILAIKFYRKFLSKKKSYKCAKGHVTGETCSKTVLNDFEINGFFSGMKTYFKSTSECKVHYKNIKENKNSNSNIDGSDFAFYAGLDSLESSKNCDIGDCGDTNGSCDIGSC